MAYAVFALVVTTVYLSVIMVLVRELRISTTEERRGNQSIPLVIASTVLYTVTMIKTYQLLQLFGSL